MVSNIEPADGGAAVINGNERVLRARFADARFLWEQDKQHSLEDFSKKLDQVVFHAKLGTVADKAERISKLAGELASVTGADKEKAELAGRLSKADLVSGMVYEFPDLQGTMGQYYALADGLDADVADAIAQHYQPQGPSDDVPEGPVAQAVALADKLDTLVGFWANGELPTGSKDPFALRRAALGVVRIILEVTARISLSSVLEVVYTNNKDAFTKYGLPVAPDESGLRSQQVVVRQLLSFFADRLKIYLRDKGVKHDLVDAVFALSQNGDVQDDLLLIVRRVEALADFLSTDDGANLLAGTKRAANILRIEEKKDKTTYAGAPDTSLFESEEEKALAAEINVARDAAAKAVGQEDFAGAMAALAKLRGPVDAFFEKVTVNSEETQVRENRLKLLAEIRTALQGVADFSKIEG